MHQKTNVGSGGANSHQSIFSKLSSMKQIQPSIYSLDLSHVGGVRVAEPTPHILKTGALGADAHLFIKI